MASDYDPEEDARLQRVAGIAAARRARAPAAGSHARTTQLQEFMRHTRAVNYQRMSDLQAASVQQAARERVRLLAAHLPPDMATDQQHVWHGQDAGKLAAWRAHEAAWATFSQAPPSATAAAAAAADVPWPPHLDGMLEHMLAVDQTHKDGRTLNGAASTLQQAAMRRVFLKASLRWHPDKWPGADPAVLARVSEVYASVAAQWHAWQVQFGARV